MVVENRDNKQKIVVITLLTLIVLCVIAFFVFRVNVTRIRKFDISKYSIESSDLYDCSFSIDNNIFSGYINEGEFVDTLIVHVVIGDADRYYLLPTTLVYIEDKGWCGFSSLLTKPELLKDDSNIYLFIEKDNEEVLVKIEDKILY